MCFEMHSPDMQRIKWLDEWKIPEELKGKTLDTLEELKILLPDKNCEVVEGRCKEIFARYKIKDKTLPALSFYIAYEDVTGCGKIVLDKPKIDEGRIYCTNCNNWIGWLR